MTAEKEQKKNKTTEEIQKQYYQMPEEDLQKLILSAKRGNGRAQERLLHEFRNYLNRYVSLLYYVRWDPHNYDIRKFIALYVPDGSLRFHLKKGTLNAAGSAMVHKVLNDINFMITRYADEDDVRQTVQMTFIQCIDKYKRTKSKRNPDEWVPFSGFIYSYFYFFLKKNVDSFLIDQLGLKTFPLVTDERDDDDPETLSPGFKAPAEPGIEELIGAEALDDLWVLGDSAFAPFDSLSVHERQLIKWRYIDGLKASEIARKVTEHPNTVREHLNRLKDKLRIEYESGLY